MPIKTAMVHVYVILHIPVHIEIIAMSPTAIRYATTFMVARVLLHMTVSHVVAIRIYTKDAVSVN
jgi:hypothetical protein